MHACIYICQASDRNSAFVQVILTLLIEAFGVFFAQEKNNFMKLVYSPVKKPTLIWEYLTI